MVFRMRSAVRRRVFGGGGNTGEIGAGSSNTGEKRDGVSQQAVVNHLIQSAQKSRRHGNTATYQLHELSGYKYGEIYNGDRGRQGVA